VPPNDHGLLARLDALVALVADRHGLALLPDGRLAAAEARVAVQAAGLAAPAGAGPVARPGGRGRAAVERDAVELLRAVAEGVGLLRVRGDRLEPTSLRNAWTQIDESLRAGLTFAACCHGVHWSDCGPGRFSMMLRSLDRSNGLVVKPALHDPDRRGERQVVGWSLVVRVKKRSVVAAGG
jgi:hypothetical protein